MRLEPFPLQPGVSMHIPAGCTVELITLKHRNSRKNPHKIEGVNGRAAPEKGCLCLDKLWKVSVSALSTVGALGWREGAALAGCMQ